MLSTRVASALTVLRGSQSRIVRTPVRNVYRAVERSSVLRPSSTVYRCMSNEESSAEDRSFTDKHYVSQLDRITLIATRTMRPEEIGDFVGGGTMDKANNRRRIGINLLLVLATLVTGVVIIKKSQKGIREHTLVNLHEQNKERYKRLREEDAKAEAAAAAAAAKK